MVDYFNKECTQLLSKKIFFFDMDGTLYSDNKLFDGTLALLENINKSQSKYIFMTNNSSKSIDDYCNKLKKLGIVSNKENFSTSSQATSTYLKKHHPNDKIYCVGTNSFISELKEKDLQIIEDYEDDCNCIVVGYDTELTYHKLSIASRILLKSQNIHYYATNIDRACPTNFGFIPDCGAICEALRFATNKTPIFLGKPQPNLILDVLDKFNIPKEEAVVVGDRLYTDILCGINASVDTIAVLTGEIQESDFPIVESERVKPNYVFKSVKELNHVIFTKDGV